MLDALKGFSCLLMLLAHARLPSLDPSLTPLVHLGELAPIFFFAVCGVTAHRQSVRKGQVEITFKYLALFVLGFSYNGVIPGSPENGFKMEILQFVALSSIMVTYLAFLNYDRWWIALLLASACILVHLLVQLIGVAPFPGSKVIIAPSTFPIFPWLSFCFLGIAAAGMSQRARIVAVAACAVLLSSALLAGSGSFNKWDMTAAYFLLSSSLVFLAFWAAATRLLQNVPEMIFYLGKHSLLFLFLHWAWIKAFVKLDVAAFGDRVVLGLVAYGAIAACTLASMPLALLANRHIRSAFDSWTVWIALMAAIILVPAAPIPNGAIWLVEFVCGVAVAMNYRALSPLARSLAADLRQTRPSSA